MSVVEAIAGAIAARGVRPMDALHVASAIIAGANWLLTTDKGLLKPRAPRVRNRASSHERSEGRSCRAGSTASLPATLALSAG